MSHNVAAVNVTRMNGPNGTVLVKYALHDDGSTSPFVVLFGDDMEHIADSTAAMLQALTAASGVIGAQDDLVATDHTGDWSVLSLLKRVCALLNSLPTSRGKHAADTSFPVTLASDELVTVQVEPGTALPVTVANDAAILVKLSTGTTLPVSWAADAVMKVAFASTPTVQLPANQSVTLNATDAAGGAKSWRASTLTKTPVQIKAGAGRLYKFRGSNTLTVGARTIRLYDKASAPDLTADKPLWTISLNPLENRVEDFQPEGLQFAAGLWAVAVVGILDIDTLLSTVTGATSGDTILQVAYY